MSRNFEKALGRFKTDVAKDACRLLVKRVDASVDWRGKWVLTNAFPDYQICSAAGGRCYFSVTANDEHLTFRFRNHATASARWGYWKLEKFFNDPEYKLRKTKTEFIVRLFTQDDVDTLGDILKLKKVKR
jgi:hypothetical protein